MRSTIPRAQRRTLPPRALGLHMLAVGATIAACGGAPAPVDRTAPSTALVPTSKGALGRIEIRQITARPRLTLVSREGDPTPAVVVAVATDLSPVATTALGAVVEQRLKQSGLDVQARIDRSAFRLEWLAGDATRIDGFFAAVMQAFQQPITAASPELAVAARYLVSLRHNPLDAPEMVPIASCTGQLGIAANEPAFDLRSAAGVRSIELWRRTALHATRTSVAAVGTAPFCMAAARALEKAEGWALGPPVTDAWPAADTAGTYLLAGAPPATTRLAVAVRSGSVHAAIAAAERLGALDSPLQVRLPNLPLPFHAVHISGVARPRGGCVSVTLEASVPAGFAGAGDPSLEAAAALAAAVVRQEIRIELARPASSGIATRQILSAADPREAASRAAWWALAGSVAAMPPRSAIAMGYPAGIEQFPGSRERFEAELGRALAMTNMPVSERRVAVERGQGEFWLLLASPCGATEESRYDAGATALGALAAVDARRGGNVALEPWISADGIGVIAHAALLDEGETPSALARRVADAAANTLVATTLPAQSMTTARAIALEHLERTAGRHGAAFEQLIGAVIGDHPSWLEPFGLWSRIAGEGLATAQLRWQAVATGPIRLALLANASDAQAAAAAEAVDRWFVPRDKPRTCPGGEPAPARPGRYDIALPSDTPLAQVMIGVLVPPSGAADHALAEMTALALDGRGGLLETLLAAHPGAAASARIAGGSRASVLLIDARVPPADLDPLVTDLQALLGRLTQSGGTDKDLSRALAEAAKRAQYARTTPRRRLIDLWLAPAGQPAQEKGPAPITQAAWNAWMAGALRESSLIVVVARPQ